MSAPTASYDVLGRTVTMPVQVRDASAATLMFDVGSGAVAALLPGDAFEVVETAPGRAQVSLSVIDYRDNDLGDYDEVAVTFFVRPRDGGEDGTFIYALPVNQEFTCAAGCGIWGFPKTVEDIAVVYADDSVTATLRMGGALVLRLTAPRGGADSLPEMPMTTYTYRQGAAHATTFTQSGEGVLFGDPSAVRLELGDAPLAVALATLGLADTPPSMVVWNEHMRGTFESPRPL